MELVLHRLPFDNVRLSFNVFACLFVRSVFFSHPTDYLRRHFLSNIYCSITGDHSK